MLMFQHELQEGVLQMNPTVLFSVRTMNDYCFREETMMKWKGVCFFTVLSITGLGACDEDNITSEAPARYREAGSLTVTEKGDAPSGFEVFRPAELTGNHPVLTWQNGTAYTPAVYREFLTHLASHGYVIFAADSFLSSGSAAVRAVEWAIEQNDDSRSTYYKKLDTTATAAMGHSLGGTNATSAATDPIFKTSVLIAPCSTRNADDLAGPTLYVAVSGDMICLGVKRGFDDAPVEPKAYIEWQDQRHFNLQGDLGSTRPWITAWLDFILREDEDAGNQFRGADCGICKDQEFEIETKGI